jgi:hypothetical protein
MDIPILASILTGSFLNFRGDPETLYRCLLSRNDFRSLAGVPSNARGFLSKLREMPRQSRRKNLDFAQPSSATCLRGLRPGAAFNVPRTASSAS